ncbi:arginine--tRNA ligase [Desulfomonile tiedjei]|uniref:Arginine--tRNA ligase n=1 Tax=Desulfomonile tiedjei (strain ATCC 49306 / DSM 6799 / DCB-1) TaxID=706587 RepID=I4CAH9_DESTA|nr:arginine--tRNA ligase [Desulfomonile tiedjei]AFM26570.1 arginyl-tRNA synthetase [Desulfomonile tiedjei DSM 6799]
MKEVVRSLVLDALKKAVTEGQVDIREPESVLVEVSRSKDPRFGDYATNIALVLSGPAKLKPRQLAEIVVQNLNMDPSVLAKAEIAGPGFINFFLATEVWHKVLATIHEEKEVYGASEKPDSPRVLLEFVSANPTGPLHVGHGRGAAVGDTLARLLRKNGYNLHTEYYVNDAGNQMRILGRSLYVRYKQMMGEQIEFPENHYRGDYILELAKELKGTQLGAELLELPEDEAVEKASRYACSRILDGIQEDLRYFGVEYDGYFSERTLHESGMVTATVRELQEKGKAEEHDGAVWFAMNEQQDEKDRVLVRATGEPTYFAADAAYHLNKLQRGYGLLVDIWGSDHHGYVPRVRAAVEALGYSPDSLKVMLVQFVNLVREGQKISMSTRSGEFITLRDVLDEVGPDAARFFFLTKRSDSHLDFDLDLAKKQSRENPVYYVQYMHARIASIFRIGQERNIDTDMTDPDLSVLALPEEQRLMKHLADFPDMLREAAEALEPHRVTFYLMELADMFHAYYHDNRVLTEDSDLKKARLFLAEAVRQVVANGLDILGVTAPERM